MSDSNLSKSMMGHAIAAAWLASFVLDAGEREDWDALEQAGRIAARLRGSADPRDDGSMERLELVEALAGEMACRAEPPGPAAHRVLSHLARDLFRLPRWPPSAIHLAA